MGNRDKLISQNLSVKVTSMISEEKFSKLTDHLICPHCINPLVLTANNRNFKNPLYSVFENEIIHSASDEFKTRLNSQCAKCDFPIEVLVRGDSRLLEISFPFDWLIIGEDPIKWIIWKSKQINSFTAGVFDPPASYSSDSNAIGNRFREFLRSNLGSSVPTTLDVGCGALSRPVYLDGFSMTSLYGMDPFESDFEGHRIKGTAEFIPLESEFFDLVIASSTIDHFFNWKKSVEEINRVLKSGGNLAIYQHVSESLVRYKASKINGRWFRLFETGYLVELEGKFADPFHSKESQEIEWSAELAKFLRSLNYELVSEINQEGFTFWRKTFKEACR
jgi:SAM-dependent methyltransferase